MSTTPDEDQQPAGRLDRVSLLLAAATLAFVSGAAWLKFRAPAEPEPPTVGSTLPPLRLLNLETSEPLFLLGLKGKVIWLTFWSAGSPSGRAVLPRLEDAWRRLRSHGRFTLVAAAVDADHPEQVRGALKDIRASLPAYLATPETRRRFGADQADPPLHLLIDSDGRVAALVRGAGRETIDRLSGQVQGWLEELEPLGPIRFAQLDAASPPARSARR
jgi:hypothetical protein